MPPHKAYLFLRGNIMKLASLIGATTLWLTLTAASTASAAWTPWDNNSWRGNNYGSAPYGYGAPNTYGAPGGYGAPNTYGAPGGYGAPNTYGAPGGYGAPRGYGYGPYAATPYRPYYRKRRSKNNWMPWDSGPFGDLSGPWDSGPWNPDWLDGRWSGDDIFGAGPDGWMDPEDPKGSMSRFWDDMLTAPYEFGEMPGGWTAPSISVPNPVEVGDEFEGSSRLAPKEAAEQMDNFEMN